VCNLDPAAEIFKYKCDIDIRDLISLDDVMEELGYGPNGGLIYCMEFLLDNIDWLTKELSEFGDESYIIFDCPGQIELYSHLNIMTRVIEKIKASGFNHLCCVYIADATQCAFESHKYISNTFISLATMVQIELPHMNVMTKCDLLSRPEEADKLTEQTCTEML